MMNKASLILCMYILLIVIATHVVYYQCDSNDNGNKDLLMRANLDEANRESGKIQQQQRQQQQEEVEENLVHMNQIDDDDEEERKWMETFLSKELKNEIEEAENEEKPKPSPDEDKESCWKDAKYRGVGKLPEDGECKDDLEKDFGLCYKECDDGYKGIGSFCWKECKDPFVANGVLFCCKDKKTCAKYLWKLDITLPSSILKAAIDIAVGRSISRVLKDLKAIVEDALELKMPLCSKAEDDDDDFMKFLRAESD